MSKNNLIYGRAIFFLIVFVSLGVLVVTEKAENILSPRVTQTINTYIEENYNNLNNSINKEELKYKNNKYTMKVKSKDNNNLYFNITYNKGKITDTYKEDYLEGKTLLSKLNTNLEELIKNKTNENVKVNYITTLDKYTDSVKERIIKEDNLETLKFYTVTKEINVNKLDETIITTEIINTINNLNNKNITPKHYNFIITNNDDLTESIQINKITTSFITNPNNKLIISSILTNTNKDLINQSNITYKYN